MNRFLAVIPVFVLIFFSASCGVGNPTIPPSTGTDVALTQTATVWTPTATNVPDPNEPKIIEWLNEYLNSADALQQTFDVKFLVVDVLFPSGPGLLPTIFRVDVHCECSNNTPCCTPERTFVVTMWAMKERGDKITQQVPASIVEVQVVCFDHGNQIGMVVASWQDVQDYIGEKINGYQLGSRARSISLP